MFCKDISQFKENNVITQPKQERYGKVELHYNHVCSFLFLQRVIVFVVNHVIENEFLFTVQVATPTCHFAEAQKLRSVAQRRKTYIDGISAWVAKQITQKKQRNKTY